MGRMLGFAGRRSGSEAPMGRSPIGRGSARARYWRGLIRTVSLLMKLLAFQRKSPSWSKRST